MTLTLDDIAAALFDCRYPGYTFNVKVDGRGAWYLQAIYTEADIHTGHLEIQRTRRWFLSPEMSKSEIVQTALKCVLTSAEHRVREHFLYNGRRIFGPHFNIDELWKIAEVARVERPNG